jgi:hypothetical protein
VPPTAEATFTFEKVVVKVKDGSRTSPTVQVHGVGLSAVDRRALSSTTAATAHSRAATARPASAAWSRSWLRRNRKGLKYCLRDIPPERIQRVLTFQELAGSPAA